MNKLTTTAVLALVSAAFLATSASAATVAFSNGDLVLAFRDDANTSNSGNSLEVNLGLESSFDFTTSHAVTGLSETDLDAIFGTGAANVGSYSTDSSLEFSVFGTDSSHDLFYGEPVSGGYIVPTTISGTTTDSGNIGRIYVSTFNATANSAVSVEVANSNNSSYASVIRNVDAHWSGNKPFTSDFGFLTFEQTSEEAVTGGTGGVGLFEQDHFGDDPQFLGTFSLLANGTVQYSVPEPSTYALMGIAGLVLLFVRRRMIKA